MARGRALRLLACLGVAVVLGAGCSSTPQASTSLPSTSSAKPSSTLPPLGPPDLPMPAAARQMTPDGFNAFTRYYIDLINRLERTLNAAYLRQFSTDCQTCNRIANDADKDAQKGYSYRGGGITIAGVGPAHLQGVEAENAFIVDQGALSVLDRDGRPIADISSDAITGLAAGMSGRWTTDHWVVTALSFG